MKKSLFIMAALAAVAVTGCNPTGSGSYTDQGVLILSRTEQSPGLTVKTEWEYDETNYYAEKKETRTENGSVVYVVDEYENNLNIDNTLVRYRTLADGTRHKLVSTYSNYGIIKEEILDGTIPLEVAEASFSDVYKYSDYKLTKKDPETGENRVVLHRYDYTYGTPSSLYENDKSIPVTHTYKEIKDGGEPVSMAYIVGSGDDTDDNISTYKIYSNWTGSEETSTLIEQKHAYELEASGNSGTFTYKITRYDAEGLNPVTTTYEEKVKVVEITYEY